MQWWKDVWIEQCTGGGGNDSDMVGSAGNVVMERNLVGWRGWPGLQVRLEGPPHV